MGFCGSEIVLYVKYEVEIINDYEKRWFAQVVFNRETTSSTRGVDIQLLLWKLQLAHETIIPHDLFYPDIFVSAVLTG